MRRSSGNATRGQSGEMARCGSTAGMCAAEHRFRRIIGDRKLATPALAIEPDPAFSVMTREMATDISV